MSIKYYLVLVRVLFWASSKTALGGAFRAKEDERSAFWDSVVVGRLAILLCTSEKISKSFRSDFLGNRS